MACTVHAAAGKEVMRRLAKRCPEQAVEMEWREAGFARDGFQKYLRLVFSGQQITGAAETAERLVIDQRQCWVFRQHQSYCIDKAAISGNGKLSKKLWHFRFVFVTIRAGFI